MALCMSKALQPLNAYWKPIFYCIKKTHSCSGSTWAKERSSDAITEMFCIGDRNQHPNRILDQFSRQLVYPTSVRVQGNGIPKHPDWTIVYDHFGNPKLRTAPILQLDGQERIFLEQVKNTCCRFGNYYLDYKVSKKGEV